MWLEQEIVGRGANFLKIIDVGLFAENGTPEAGKRCEVRSGGSPRVFIEARGGSCAREYEVVERA